MKVGDYARSSEGDFGKIVRINNSQDIELEDSWVSYDEEDLKSSPNIIDLIEEHDILKIEEQKGVYTICEVEVFREPYEEYTFLGVRLDNRPIARKLYELNIKSIVTKECFESIEYKVKE